MTATRTTTTLATGITQATLNSALLTAFTSAGYNAPYDNYTTGTDRVLVYEFVYDASKTYGKVYYKLRITSGLSLFYQVCSAWNTATKVATNPSPELNTIVVSTTSAITFDALSEETEYKFVMLTQSTNSIIMGIICPFNKPGWWNVNAFPYGFAVSNSALNAFAGCTLNPYSNGNYISFFSTSNLATVNLQTNKRDIITGMILLTASTRGVAGKTSDDIGMGACNGSSRFDVLTFPGTTQEYLVLNPVTGGMVIRIA